MITIKTLQDTNLLDSHLRPLYEQNQWTNYTTSLPDLTVLLQNTQHVFSAWDNDKLVGLIRTVGDGAYVELIQDILVLPDYQKRGIGKQLLHCVLQETQHLPQVFLITDNREYNESVKQFYRSQGLNEFSDYHLTGFMK